MSEHASLVHTADETDDHTLNRQSTVSAPYVSNDHDVSEFAWMETSCDKLGKYSLHLVLPMSSVSAAV